MARMNSALLANGGRFGPSESSFIANIADGGQLGFGPILRNLDANTPPVYLPMTMICTHVPTIFSYIPDGIRIFKALFETHLQSFEGFEPSYQMDTDGVPIGRDGQQQMMPTRQTRSQVTPSATWSEKIGNVIFNLGRFWFNAMHDIDTQASSLSNIIPAGTILPPIVSSMFAADFLMIQHDSTLRPENIIDAYYLTNVFPTDIGSAGYSLNVNESKIPDRQFTFTALVQHNNNTIAVAKAVSRLLRLHTIQFQDALPIADGIASELSNEGLQRQVNEQISRFRNLNT